MDTPVSGLFRVSFWSTSIGRPSTRPPNSSAAICAASRDPFPPIPTKGPLRSDATPMRIGPLAPFTVTTVTEANYRGVQGELPFQYWDKSKALFADCMSPRGDFATLDYSDDKPVLYRGVIAGFDSLHLTNLRTFEGWG